MTHSLSECEGFKVDQSSHSSVNIFGGIRKTGPRQFACELKFEGVSGQRLALRRQNKKFLAAIGTEEFTTASRRIGHRSLTVAVRRWLPSTIQEVEASARVACHENPTCSAKASAQFRRHRRIEPSPSSGHYASARLELSGPTILTRAARRQAPRARMSNPCVLQASPRMRGCITRGLWKAKNRGKVTSGRPRSETSAPHQCRNHCAHEGAVALRTFEFKLHAVG